MADLCDGTVAIIGHRLDHNGHAVRAVAFVYQLFVVLTLAGTGPAADAQGDDARVETLPPTRVLDGNGSGTTSGVLGSMRKAEELSITTAPAALAWGMNSRLRVAPALDVRPNIPVPDTDTLKALLALRFQAMTDYQRNVFVPALREEAAMAGAKLRKLLPRDETLYIPTHGAEIRNPNPFVQAYIEHRLGREAQIMARLKEGPQTVPQMVAKNYADTPIHLHAAAGRSMLAHLVQMVKDGRVRTEDGRATIGSTYRL